MMVKDFNCLKMDGRPSKSGSSCRNGKVATSQLCICSRMVLAPICMVVLIEDDMYVLQWSVFSR